MKRVQLTNNFYLDEYIPRELYMQHIGYEHRLIGLIDRRVVIADQKLRERFGATTINNWWGLSDEQFKLERSKPAGHVWVRNESGLRLHGTSTGASLSQHLYGRASDKIYNSVSAREVREYIKLNYQALGITCIEDNVSWVHSDTRYHTNSGLLVVHP